MSTPEVGESTRTVVVAMAANLGVALAKAVAAALTGSTAMAAEAAHALADVGNQVLLLVAQVRSRRPADDRHPFGHGRDAYFWALLASVGVFVAGSLFSVREGITQLLDPTAAESFAVGYVVLVVAAALDLVSLRQAVRQLRSEAQVFQRNLLDQLLLTSDPTSRAVFAEDAAAIAGDAIAFVGLALHQATGSPIPDGVAAVLIGLLVAGVAWQLARRNHDFLLGEQAPDAVRADIEGFLVAFPGVVGVRELLVTFVGPRRVWVLARVDIDDELRGVDVEALARSIESDLEAASPYVMRVDIVPIGAAPPDPS
jgi:cation diffusion facilitator family transporter